MTIRLMLLVLLIGGCSWSNSLYNARRLSQSALKAEREERTFDAGSFWGQVAVKADSVLRRNPDGPRATEALWLRGRALARLRDCDLGMPLLERAQIAGSGAEWQDDLSLELARCKLAGGDAERALQLVTPLLTSEEDALRDQARSLAGRSLMRAERWEEAREFLAEDETTEGVWLHALSLARLGRAVEALEVLEVPISVGDSLPNWGELFNALASVPGNAGSSDLRARLGIHPWVTDTVQQRWDLITARAMMSHDSTVATMMLQQITEGPRTTATMQARMLLADRLMAGVVDDTTLATALARIEEYGRADPAMQFQAEQRTAWGRSLRADLDSIQAGAPEGDLMLYFHATVARDTLKSPGLAAWLLTRLEQQWPASPYVPKAILARMQLQPDSLAALRARLETHTDSPYLAFVQGREDPRFAELEWALDFYLAERFATTAERGIQ